MTDGLLNYIRLLLICQPQQRPVFGKIRFIPPTPRFLTSQNAAGDGMACQNGQVRLRFARGESEKNKGPSRHGGVGVHEFPGM